MTKSSKALSDAEEGEAWALLEVAAHELYFGACNIDLATVRTKLHELQKLVKKLERGGVAKAINFPKPRTG